MVRLLVIVLCLQTFVADVAQGLDLHAEAGCADSTLAATSDTGDDGPPAGSHAGACCFGSLLLGSPAAPLPHTLLVSAGSPIAARNHCDVTWHSEGPERPPRS